MLLHEKKLYASPADGLVYSMLKEAGVIVPHHPHKVCGKQICTHCADGFRPHYKERIKDLCFSNGGSKTFFHTFSGNGDPMRYAYRSPLSPDGTDSWGELKVQELAETMRWADSLHVEIEQMRDVHHWPCKAGLSRNINFEQSIDLVARGKHRIKHQIPRLKVALELFIDWGDHDQTMDVIEKDAYVAFLGTVPTHSRQYEAWLAYEESVKTLPIIHDAPWPLVAVRA